MPSHDIQNTEQGDGRPDAVADDGSIVVRGIEDSCRQGGRCGFAESRNDRPKVARFAPSRTCLIEPAGAVLTMFDAGSPPSTTYPKPNHFGWASSCPERQYWRGSRPCALERRPVTTPVSGLTFLAFLSLLSVVPVSVHEQNRTVTRRRPDHGSAHPIQGHARSAYRGELPVVSTPSTSPSL